MAANETTAHANKVMDAAMALGALAGALWGITLLMATFGAVHMMKADAPPSFSLAAVAFCGGAAGLVTAIATKL
ncbi:MAG: hypothetical protein M0Z28_09635 [Rhodospirillales bacterium]|nr:hypothetical protein [Rhodospirillales bacterium]